MRLHVVAAVATLIAATSPMAMTEETAISSTEMFGTVDFTLEERIRALSNGNVLVPECRPIEGGLSTPLPQVEKELVSAVTSGLGQCTEAG